MLSGEQILALISKPCNLGSVGLALHYSQSYEDTHMGLVTFFGSFIINILIFCNTEKTTLRNMSMTSFCCFFPLFLCLILPSFSLASSLLFKILPQDTSLKILFPFETVKLKHTHTKQLSVLKDQTCGLVSVTTKLLCQQKPFVHHRKQSGHNNFLSSSSMELLFQKLIRQTHYQKSPLATAQKWSFSFSSSFFYNHQTINSQSGYILFYLSFLFIKLAGSAH